MISRINYLIYIEKKNIEITSSLSFYIKYFLNKSPFGAQYTPELMFDTGNGALLLDRCITIPISPKPHP